MDSNTATKPLMATGSHQRTIVRAHRILTFEHPGRPLNSDSPAPRAHNTVFGLVLAESHVADDVDTVPAAAEQLIHPELDCIAGCIEGQEHLAATTS